MMFLLDNRNYVKIILAVFNRALSLVDHGGSGLVLLGLGLFKLPRILVDNRGCVALGVNSLRVTSFSTVLILLLVGVVFSLFPVDRFLVDLRSLVICRVDCARMTPLTLVPFSLLRVLDLVPLGTQTLFEFLSNLSKLIRVVFNELL